MVGVTWTEPCYRNGRLMLNPSAQPSSTEYPGAVSARTLDRWRDAGYVKARRLDAPSPALVEQARRRRISLAWLSAGTRLGRARATGGDARAVFSPALRRTTIGVELIATSAAVRVLDHPHRPC